MADSEKDTLTGSALSTLEVVPEESDVTGTAASPLCCFYIYIYISLFYSRGP